MSPKHWALFPTPYFLTWRAGILYFLPLVTRKNRLATPVAITTWPTRAWGTALFILSQIIVLLCAITSESLWIDEFWTAHFSTIHSVRELYDLLVIPNGSQTPLHFIYYYLWGLVFGSHELSLRLANLPLFLLGQLSLFLALRDYPGRFTYLLLGVSALHPMVWQYANEARPYIMMYAGSQMILAYMLNLHSTSRRRDSIDPTFSAIFVFGGILLSGASLLGVFSVVAACGYVAYFHHKNLNWMYLKSGVNLSLGCFFLTTSLILVIYYLNSIFNGAGASRISSTTFTTVIFDGYELLGLSGVGPGRLELRDSGISSLRPYFFPLALTCGLFTTVLLKGFVEVRRLLGARELVVITIFTAAPVAIILASGFLMHWRVLGRHLIAILPALEVLFALGLLGLLNGSHTGHRRIRSGVVAAFFLLLICSSASLRLLERHRKDDYRAAAAVAEQGVLEGRKVWWAADAVGAHYYRVPGSFDFLGELTGNRQPQVCVDQPGVQSVANASRECLQQLSAPDIVILSKPEVFDTSGEITNYLKLAGFAVAREFPAFKVWQHPGNVKKGQR